MSVTICAAGDAMLLKDFPKGYDYHILSEIISSAQIKAVNVEMVLSNRDCFASTFCGGNWINSEPQNFSNLHRYGFNLFACANNHSMDYSFDGVLSTCNVIEEELSENEGYAGIGESLDVASKPAYISVTVDNKSIVVALISLTTTFIDAARAGYGNQYYPARPGVNAVRHKEVYYCTKEQMEELQALASDTYINGERDNARKIGSLPPEMEGTLNFGGIFFKVSEEKGKMTSCHEGDLGRILNSIQEAREKADYVIVMPHSHNIKHGSYTEPDYFFEELCRKCIDGGADCVFGGGTHQLKPIEIYNGKPIFYSLGNFIFQSHLLDSGPSDFWEKYNLPKTLTFREVMDKKLKGGSIGLATDFHNYLSIIPFVKFDNHNCTEIELVPISLQFEQEKGLKGLPTLTNPDETEYIFQYLKTISNGYGTALSLDENKITVKL